MIGCSGWNYPQDPEDGGWVKVFYPNKNKLLSYYSQFFKTVEMDATFYEKFFSKMNQATFAGMVAATPDDFEFSVKVPETITHNKKMDVTMGALDDFKIFLDKISPLKRLNKLEAVLFQLSPSFTVKAFRKVENLLDRLPAGYDYAVEFRHPSWETEGPWELLKQYNVAIVMTDSPDERLKYLPVDSMAAFMENLSFGYLSSL